MSLSSNGQGYSGFPEEEMARHYRNVLLHFKKTIQTSKDIDELKSEMEHFMNSSRKVTWPHHTSGVYHKDEAEKAVGKVITEFERYITALQKNPSELAPHQDLLEALLIVESMLDRLKGR
jgi:hypothetical protein